MTEDSNRASVAQFDRFARELKQNLPRQYDRRVNKDLSQQRWQDLLLRNITDTLLSAYGEALTQLRQLPLRSGEPGTSAEVLQSFEGLIDDLLQYALRKHRTSCALSNFPDEHNPSRDYIGAVLEQTRKDWLDFAAEVEVTLS